MARRCSGGACLEVVDDLGKDDVEEREVVIDADVLPQPLVHLAGVHHNLPDVHLQRHVHLRPRQQGPWSGCQAGRSRRAQQFACRGCGGVLGGA